MTIEYKHDGRFILNMQESSNYNDIWAKGLSDHPNFDFFPRLIFSIIFNFNPTLIFQLSPQYSTPSQLLFYRTVHICISSLVISLVIDTQNDGQALNR